MKIIFSLTALQILIASDLVIQKSLQASGWYCSLVNNSSCTNPPNFVNCTDSSNTSCNVYSCNQTSTGCSCMVGLYNCTNNTNTNCQYNTPDLCSCKTATYSCSCLSELGNQDLTSVSPEHVMDIVGQIINISENFKIPSDLAENYLKALDSAQMRISEMSSNISDLAANGNTMLKAYDVLVSALVEPTNNLSYKNYSYNSTEIRVLAIGPNLTTETIPSVQTKTAQMDIDIRKFAQSSRRAAVSFISYGSMEDILKADFFKTSDKNTNKTMMSSVISATLYNSTGKLLDPVNFTLKHIKELNNTGNPFCVYWNITEWVVEGCSLVKTYSNYTVCSCGHLSTFALIMQFGSPPTENDLLEKVNLVAVIVGLVFLSLALLTFAFCRWKPGVNNVARINLCISLLLAHLLFLLTQSFLDPIKHYNVVCAVISGALHFFFLSCFVWMFIEAVLLFIRVKNLSQISSRQRAVLSSRFLIVIGYVIAFVIVGVSVGLVPEGYGSDKCWIKQERGFIWSFLGPVCFILAINTIIFISIIIILNSTLKKLNAEVSRMKQTKIMVFKTLAQCVILGCPWILGFFTVNNQMMEILFLILNSQQGTFIFIIHCVLNNEVRQQYGKWMRGFFFRDEPKTIKESKTEKETVD
ncbi:adhesion G protein-coupled receptor E3-like isoform X2 [Paramisgurnus dabryanus]|uniref:adhesion G protein-coupled receptor E3-like isoform X2 n=1 Tax=Paramisgurnus dabryanus TaxID=90735 RepID=UPI0031F37A17